MATWRRRLTWPVGVGLLAGASPLVLYAVINAAVFGTVMPVSGEAKQLAPLPVFSDTVLRHLALELRIALAEGRFSVYLTQGLAPALVTLAALAAHRRLRPQHPYWAATHLALLVFPFALLALQALVSDWILWPWYLYAFLPALITVPAALARAGMRGGGSEGMPRSAILAIAALVGVAVAKTTPAQQRLEYGMADASLRVAAFAERHDGRLAMGDRAGRVGFLVPHRVLQLEGLVGSRDFLESIRAQSDLVAVLRERGVRYYVGTQMERIGSCHVGEEPKPAQAGAKSPRMTGRFCAEPVLRHVDNLGVVTLVFDVAAEAAKR
jgi:hypothetical protein